MNTVLKFLEWRWYCCGADSRMNNATTNMIERMLPADLNQLEVLLAALEWDDFKHDEKQKRGYQRWTLKQN